MKVDYKFEVLQWLLIQTCRTFRIGSLHPKDLEEAPYEWRGKARATDASIRTSSRCQIEIRGTSGFNFESRFLPCKHCYFVISHWNVFFKSTDLARGMPSESDPSNYPKINWSITCVVYWYSVGDWWGACPTRHCARQPKQAKLLHGVEHVYWFYLWKYVGLRQTSIDEDEHFNPRWLRIVGQNACDGIRLSCSSFHWVDSWFSILVYSTDCPSFLSVVPADRYFQGLL